MRSLIEMSEKDIDALEAGPEVRALVARDVLGIKMGRKMFKNRTGYRLEWPSGESVHDNGTSYYGWGYNQNEETAEFYYPAVDSDISAAWLVVDKMQSNGFCFDADGDAKEKCFRFGVGQGIGAAKTAPLAICKAALKAVRAMRLRDLPEDSRCARCKKKSPILKSSGPIERWCDDCWGNFMKDGVTKNA